jgi:hypothetical protein
VWQLSARRAEGKLDKMKDALKKTLLTSAALLLVVPFVGLALVVGARAVAVTGGARGGLLVALAIGGTLVSALRSARLRLSSQHAHAFTGRRIVLKHFSY